MKMENNKQKTTIDVAMLRLDHIPFVVSNNKRMAVWTDVKEILLWCPSPHCCVVLDNLKLLLGYPTNETNMHPCSQLEQLMFLKHFMFVTHGTLLVDIDSLKDVAKLYLLFQLVKEKHTKPCNNTVLNCTKMLKGFTEKYANTSFKIPLTFASTKLLLPAVRRIQNIVLHEESNTIEREHLQSNDSCGTTCSNMLEATEPNGQTELAGKISMMLVPLSLLHKLYPGCEMFLNDVVRLYVLGKCGQENLQSVCQCTVEEGIQLTRFLASQNGYSSSWWCLSTCSLLISWSDFWLGVERVYGGRLEPFSKDVCVVTINCQEYGEPQDKMLLAYKKTKKTAVKQNLTTSPSPTLSTVTDITKNIRSQNVKRSLSILSAESHNTWKDSANVCKCSESCNSDINTKLNFDYPHTDNIENTLDKVEIKQNQDNIKMKHVNETFKEDSLADGEKNESEIQENRKKKGKVKTGKTDDDRKRYSPECISRKLENGKFENIDGDLKTLNVSISKKTKKYKAKQKKKNVKGQLGPNVSEGAYASNGIKSRLRNRTRDKKMTCKEVLTVNINNSASGKAKSEKQSISGKSHTSETKSNEKDSSICSDVDTREKVKSQGAQYIKLKVELPMSEVSPYDLASMEYPDADGIQVTPKSTDLYSENIPGEIHPEIPLVSKRNTAAKQNVDTLQSIKDRRELLKIHSPQFQDQFPKGLKYFPKKFDAGQCHESLVLAGKQKNWIGSFKRGMHGTQDQQGKFDDKTVEPMVNSVTPNKNGILQQEIANGIYKQASYAFLSAPGNLTENKPLTAEGKAMKKHVRVNDLNTTEFMTERITMWKDELDQSRNISPSGRLIKSADFARRKTMCTYRPMSSIYSSPVNKSGPSIKTALYALYSRDRATPEMCDKQIQAETLYNENAGGIKDICRTQNSANPSSLWMSKTGTNKSRTGSGTDRLRQEHQYDVQHFGSSSSLTPDIYDEFARTRKPKSVKLECEKIKQKQVTKPIPTTLSQSVTRIIAQPNSTTCKKPNNHTVGYISGVESTQIQNIGLIDTWHNGRQKYRYTNVSPTKNITLSVQTEESAIVKQPDHVEMNSRPVCVCDYKESVSDENRKYVRNDEACDNANEVLDGVKKTVESKQIQNDGFIDTGHNDRQTFRYTNASPTKNITLSVQTEESVIVKQSDHVEMNSRSVCVHDCKESDSDENRKYVRNVKACDNASVVLDDNKKTSPHKILSSSSPESDQTGISKCSDEEQFTAKYTLSFTTMEKTCTDVLKCHTDMNTDNTALNQPFYPKDKKNNNSSALNQLSSYQDFVVTTGRVESKDVVNNIQALTKTFSKNTKLQKVSGNASSSAAIENEDDRIEPYHQAFLNCQRLKQQGLANDKSKYIEANNQQEKTMGQDFAKLEAQLYYKIPSDAKYYPVSGNMLIPKDAQFFLPSALCENDKCIDNEHCSLDTYDNSQHLLCERNCTDTDNMHKVKEISDEKDKTQGMSSLEEDKLSGTTFENILKASEDLIDKTRMSKHIKSKTKQKIKRTELKDKMDKGVLEEENFVDDSRNENLGKEKERYQKIIKSFLQSAVDNRKTSSKKSFQEIIDERREEKRRIQEQLSKKKYWNSAQSVKGTENTQFLRYMFDNTDIKGQPDKDKLTCQYKYSMSKVYGKNKRYLRSNGRIDSKLTTTSKRRLKSCNGLSKGKVVKHREITSRGPLNTKSYTDVATKKSLASHVNFERSQYFQNTKPTIFPRAKNIAQKEKYDCTNTILTALRRLSIEKSPKAVESKRSPKRNVQTSMLRSCVSKQASSLKLVTLSKAANSNDQKNYGSRLVDDQKNSNTISSVYNMEEPKLDIANVSKIPVVISKRDESGHYGKASEVSEEFEDGNKDNGYCLNDNYEISNQRKRIDLMKEHHKGMGKELEKQSDDSDSVTVDSTEHREEVFITLYDTHELGLYTLDSSFLKSPSSLSVDVCQGSEEKYLGKPYFQFSNADINGIECKVSNENMTLKKDKEEKIYSSEENDQLKFEHFAPDDTFSQIKIPNVSTVYVQSQNLDQDECNNIDTDSALIKNKRLNCTFERDAESVNRQIPDYGILNTTNSNATQRDVNDNSEIDIAESRGNCVDFKNFTIAAYDLPAATNASFDGGIFDKIMVDSFYDEGKFNVETEEKMRYEIDSSACETESYLSDKLPYTLENFNEVYFCQPVMFEPIMHQPITQTISESCICLETEAEGTDMHLKDEDLLAADVDCLVYNENKGTNDFIIEAELGQLSNDVTTNDNSDSDIFLDETDCGQEVYVGNRNDLDQQDLENGLEMFPECEIFINSNQEIHDAKGGDNVDVIFEEKSGELQHNLQHEIYSGKYTKDKRPKRKCRKKTKAKKTKKLIRSEPAYSKQVTSEYSPSQSEIDAYFQEVTKRTTLSGKSNNNDSDINSKSDDSLPEFTQDLNIKTKEVNKTKPLKILSTDNKCTVNLKLKDDTENDGDIDDTYEEDGDYDDDDDDDVDYEPDMDEFHALTDHSGSDSDTSIQKACSETNIPNCKFKHGKYINQVFNKMSSGKKSKVSLKNVRKKIQRKYNIKNSSAIHEWKKKLHKKKERKDQLLNIKPSNCKQSEEQVKSIVREFCSKHSQDDNEIENKIKSNMVENEEKQLESETIKNIKNVTGSEKSQISSSSYSDISCTQSEENIRRKTCKKAGMKQEKVKYCDDAQGKRTKKAKRKKKRVVKDVTLDENSEEEQMTKKEEAMAAEGFIKTQKRYYEILRHSNINSLKTEKEISTEQSVDASTVGDLSDVIEAVPVHGERVITKALSDAEKALEGTGSLDDIHKEDEGVVIEDLLNKCRYQMIEDEDHVQLGGMAHFQDFVLPFVYINGYKYTPLKDALTIFTQDCCVSACTIPRSVLQKHKTLVKSFSTWEQVYKLELIKMKKGPGIKTGDMLVKLNTLLALLPELTQQIVNLHRGTKLKRSQNCDIRAYETLRSKLK